MGRRGPPKKTTEEKRLTGNPGEKKLSDYEPPTIGEDEEIEIPADLGLAGRAEWEKLWPQFTQYGILRAGDLTFFHKYCKVLDELRHNELMLKAAQDDVIFMDDYEIERVIKIQRIVITLRTQMRHFQQDLGLTPASRAALKPKNPKGKNGSGQQSAPGEAPATGSGRNNVTDIGRFFKRQQQQQGTA